MPTSRKANAPDVHAAYARLRGRVRHTPLLSSSWLTRLAGRPVYLKAENLQETGSFKIRGALNLLLQLSPAERTRGVVTASAGNHGQAVAWASARLGIAATVVLPRDAVPIKVERTRSWGATIVQHGHGYDEAHRHAEELAVQQGALYVPAFDHPAVIAGQGTVALEVLADRPDVEAIVVPVGGGGLISGIALAVAESAGIALAVAEQQSHPVVMGVQSERTRGMHDALSNGYLVPVETPPTLADGLAGEVSQSTFDVCRDRGITVTLVPEDSVLSAIGATLVHEHLAVEGSAAVAVAAVQQGLLLPGAGPVALILSGGNVDPAVLSQALTTCIIPRVSLL